MLLWLWRRLAAVAPTGLLAWEPPYAMGAALKSKKKKKKKKKETPHVGRNPVGLMSPEAMSLSLKYLAYSSIKYSPGTCRNKRRHSSLEDLSSCWKFLGQTSKALGGFLGFVLFVLSFCLF